MSFKVVFHGELEFFLKMESGLKGEFYCRRVSPLKDVIESLGIPHTEVGAILLDREEKDFRFLPESGQTIDVFPLTPPVDITRPTLLRPEPFDRVAFVADVNVGKLARLLRVAGFDTAYRNSWNDSTIASLAAEESRIVLTKDRDLLKRRIIRYGRLVRAIRPWDQLEEVIHFFGLENMIQPFRICPSCNVLLERVSKEDILDSLEPLTRLFFEDFTICPSCKRIYWAGSHYGKVLLRLDRIRRGGFLH